MKRKDIAEALRGQKVTIAIKRSYNRRGFGTNTPIQYVPGNEPPKLCGQPFLKTQFNHCGFHKTLYTPSTMHVIVGKDWKP